MGPDAVFTAPFNASGLPGMSLPLHITADGLPVGVQLVGRECDESTLFRLAGQLEAAKPWKDRRPPVVATLIDDRTDTTDIDGEIPMTSVFANDAFAGRRPSWSPAPPPGSARAPPRCLQPTAPTSCSTGAIRHGAARCWMRSRASGGSAALSLGDVADAAYCDRLVAETVERFGRLNVLFNNAGICLHGPVDETSNDEWDRLIGINVSGSFYMARAAVRQMKAQGGGGAIMNMSSECGLIAYERLPAYSATKGAIVMLTKCMAIDHARDGIRVNAVCPGDIDTPMTDQGWAHLDLSSEEIRERLKEHIPLGKVGPAARYRPRGDVSGLGRSQLRHRHPAARRRRHDRQVSAPTARHRGKRACGATAR